MTKKPIFLEEESIECFCNHCDYNGVKSWRPCLDYDQARYAKRNWCGRSKIEGTRVIAMQKIIKIGNIEYSRMDKKEILIAALLEKQKE